MSGKYDRSIEVRHEEEGSYHRREVEESPRYSSSSRRPDKNYTSTSNEVQLIRSSGPSKSSSKSNNKQISLNYSSDEDNFEEWTTSKRKVNHTTRQVETRVSRQLLVEDGKVIADSGPQVTTRIKEDNKVEECEKEKAPKNKGRFDALEQAPEVGSNESSGRVLGEKKEIQRVSREVREENMQYHDERFKELTGHDVHRRAIQAPHELITITDPRSGSSGAPRGKMVHYSNKGKKYQDTDEILEVAKLAIDGSITKEVKRTRHHEECSEDEKPDETGEAEALREAPTVTRSSRRHVDYVNDFDDLNTPDCSSSSSDDDNEGRSGHRRREKSTKSSRKSAHRAHGDQADSDQAFPRYQIDPLLNSLRDEDFRPASSNLDARAKPLKLERKSHAHSSSSDLSVERAAPVRSPVASGAPVEIPEEYRANRQRLMGSRSSVDRERERSFSPAEIGRARQRQHQQQQVTSSHSKLSHRHKKHNEDQAVQAHLTDEEEQRPQSSANDHQKATQHLQRQSTTNSSRRYYFGDQQQANNRQKQQSNKADRRAPSVSPSISSASSRSSSLSDPKERQRQKGVRSRDSGFREIQRSRHNETPTNQIYSVSSKSKSRRQQVPVSPAPTEASLGQRSVKTTTTTLSAGLADRQSSRRPRRSISPPLVERPYSRQSRDSQDSQRRDRDDKPRSTRDANYSQVSLFPEHNERSSTRQLTDDDNRSTSGVATIKVPYKQMVRRHEIVAEPAEQPAKQQQRTPKRRQREPDQVLQQQPVAGSTDELRSNSSDIDYIPGPVEPRFDYRTVIANVRSNNLMVPRQQQILNTYNVHLITNSPFHTELAPVATGSDISSGIARLELLSSKLIAKPKSSPATVDKQLYRPERPETTNSGVDHGAPKQEADLVSMVSSNSLHSSRTYDIRSCSDMIKDEEDLDDESHFPVALVEPESSKRNEIAVEDSKARSAAWIFDLKDGSSTTIVAPPKPAKPALPKVDSTELAQSKGGRSYYLELSEPVETKQRPSSIDSLYSRSNSHSTLGHSTSNPQPTLRRRPLASSSQQLSADNKPQARESRKPSSSRGIRASNQCATSNRARLQTASQTRLARPTTNQNNSPASSLLAKSRSVSCLVNSTTKPSKYSIYGGLRNSADSNKPVPRLSYSRAIGPKSQRQLDAQSKVQSRYLKMR